jgi:UDP-glucose 4-epimerase
VKLVPYDEDYEVGFEDMPRRVPDLSKVHEYVGYVPQRSLDDILRSVIEHSRVTPGSL